MIRRLPFPILALAAALTFSGMYFLTALPRIVYPYDLDFIEDSMLMQSLRFARGLSVFGPPSADFVPHIYMPLYTWLGGLLFRLTGPSLASLRLLSFAATLITAVLIFYITRRESGLRWLGLACAGLYLGGYRISGFWYELARVDSLYVTLTLGGVALGIYAHGSPKRLIPCAVLMALTFFTKQTGLAFAAGLAGYLFFSSGRLAWWFIIPYALLVLIPLLSLNAFTHGWFFYYVFFVAEAVNAKDFGRTLHFLGPELFGLMGGLSITAGATAWLAWRRRGLFVMTHQGWLGAISIAALASGAGRTSVGGNLNNLMAVYGFLCLAPALFMCEIMRTPWRGIGEHLVTLAIVAQLALGVYNPLRYIPTTAMRGSGRQLIERVAAVDGPVLVMMHPYYALLAGKDSAAQVAQLWYFTHWLGLPLPTDFVERIHQRYYAAIISDESLFETELVLHDLIANDYVPAETLGADQAPPTTTGLTVQPKVIYLPKP